MRTDVFEACVVGIGSPHGNDSAGWRVAESLEGLLPESVRVVASVEPTRVLSLLSEYDRVWIVDACRSEQQAGEITRFAWPDERIDRKWSLSGHGVGLAEALDLAETLGSLPSKTVLYTINIDKCCVPEVPENDLSEEIVEAVQKVRDLLREEIGGEQKEYIG